MTWYREPLVHFLAAGLLVLAIDTAMAPAVPDVDRPPPIVVDEALRARLDHQLTDTLGRPPEPAERAAAVDAWVHTEVLVREAQALGLDRADPIVRERLARQVVFLTAAVTVPPEPSEADLVALWETVRDTFRIDGRVTLRQLFAAGHSGRARAEDAATVWRGGADPRTLMLDPPPGGPVLRARTHDRLATLHGEAFADAVDAMPEREPTVVRSRAGWHVVQVESRRAGGPVPFEDARDRLVLRWQSQWLEAATEDAVRALVSRHPIEGWTP